MRASALHTQGFDWANAGARMGVALSVPVAGSVLLKLTGAEHAGVLLLFPLWGFGIWLGGLFSWEALMVSLAADSTLRFSSSEISGRTGWPLRSRRSVRLDSLAHVRYDRMTFGSYRQPTHYIIVRDHYGGMVTVKFDDPGPQHDELCHLLLEALASTKGAEASPATRAHLDHLSGWWLSRRLVLAFLAYLAVTVVTALWITDVLGGMPP